MRAWTDPRDGKGVKRHKNTHTVQDWRPTERVRRVVGIGDVNIKQGPYTPHWRHCALGLGAEYTIHAHSHMHLDGQITAGSREKRSKGENARATRSPHAHTR